MRGTFSEFFAPLGHGVATSGGSELLVNHICFLLESNSEWTVLKTEVKNAFNYIQRRSSLLKSIHLHFHPCSTTFIKCTPLTVPLSTKMECHFTSSECIKETLLVPTSFQLPFTSPCVIHNHEILESDAQPTSMTFS